MSDTKLPYFRDGHPSAPPPSQVRKLGGRAIRASKVGLLVLIAVMTWIYGGTSTSPDSSLVTPLSTPDLGVPQDIQQNWGGYVPYFPAGKYQPAPPGCVIDQVSVLQRHGARYPTSSRAKKLIKTINKLKAANFTYPALQFLKTYKYRLGTETLVPFGAYQSSQAGSEVYDRYTNIVSPSNLPFVRSSSDGRVVASAHNWAVGFAKASNGTLVKPPLSVVLSEQGKDTLADRDCSARNPHEEPYEWLSTFITPITQYLNEGIQGVTLNNQDTYSLISLCPLETVAYEKKSPFCDIFMPTGSQAQVMAGAFPGFQYVADLLQYYGEGYGQEPWGPIQGIGYIAELIARLTGNRQYALDDHTKVDPALDSTPTNFPLDRAVYADFTHDTLLIPVYSAMGLFPQSSPLSAKTPNPERTWTTSKMVTFSARMVVERLQCQSSDTGSNGTVSVPSVRIFVNDAKQPLAFCNADKDGVCTVAAFVESQKQFVFDKGQEDWKKCNVSEGAFV